MPTQVFQKDLSSGGARNNFKMLNVLLGDDNRTLMFQIVVAKPMSPTSTQDVNVEVNEAQVDLVLRLCGIR
jgi:hypothetical protein